MAKIAEVKRQNNESTSNLLRRFTKRAQSTNALTVVRGKRYHERDLSDLKKKRGALVRIEKREVFEKMKKLGKTIETKKRR
jgi:ribosomal protein S21